MPTRNQRSAGQHGGQLQAGGQSPPSAQDPRGSIHTAVTQEIPNTHRRTIGEGQSQASPRTSATAGLSGKIKEHMQVVCSDNTIAGSVDHLDPNATIKLTRDAAGRHHWIPMALVIDVDAKGVHLGKPIDQVRKQWRDTPPGSAHV